MRRTLCKIVVLTLCLLIQIQAPWYAQEALNYAEIAEFDLAWPVQSFSWSQDSSKLALGMCGVEQVRILDIASGDYEVIETQSRCAKVDWDTTTGLLAIVDNSWQCDDNNILIWQEETSQLIHTIETRDCIRSIQWNRDGTRLLAYLKRVGFWSVQAWDVANWNSEILLESGNEEDWVETIALSPDGTLLAVANNHKHDDSTLPSIDIYELATGKMIQQLTRDHSNGFIFQDLLLWSPQGNILIARITDLGNRGSADFWDLRSGEIFYHSNSSAIAWHPTENYLAVNIVPDDAGQGTYKDIILLAPREGVLARLEGHEAEVSLLAWNHDGTRLASATYDGNMRIWSNNQGE